MKDYYQILGVSRVATQEEIKRAFRRLAIAYHPDRNPSREAESFIKEIIEAYQVLEDPVQRQRYDELIEGNFPLEREKPARPHRDPYYRRQPPNPHYRSEKQRMLDMMQANMKYALFMSWCTVAFSLVLALDFSLPPRQQTEIIKTFKRHRYVTDAEKFTTDRGNEFKVDRLDLQKLRAGESITVHYSPWLDVPLYLVNDQNREAVKIPATIYGNFIFIPVVLVLASLTGVGYRRGTMFRFNLGIVNFLLLLLNIIFLFIHRLHLS